MERISRVSIVGMGAMGILYGDFFARALGRGQVSFLAGSDRVRKYENRKVYCNGREWVFRFQDGAVPAPEGMPSMRQDGLAHRLSEVEFFGERLSGRGKCMVWMCR